MKKILIILTLIALLTARRGHRHKNKHDDEIMFTVILDGDYFDKNISKLDQYVCDRVIVCDSDKYCKK